MLTLDAKKREGSGKQLGTIRAQGGVPAVLYGQGVTPETLEVSGVDLVRVFREVGESALFSVKIESGAPRLVLIREIQRNPVTDKPIHVDLQQVKMDQELQISVPIEFVGDSPAAKEGIGVLIKDLHEVEVKALPQNLPASLQVDISSLATLDDLVQLKSVTLPKGVELLADQDTVVAHIGALVSEEEIAAQPEMSVEDIEVVGKKEKEEEGAEEAEGGEKEKKEEGKEKK